MSRRIAHVQTLVETGMELSRELALDVTLQRVVDLATRLAGARYGALGVLDDAGQIAQLYTTGVDPATRAAIGHLPEGKGIPGVILQEKKVLRPRDLTQDPRACGFPSHHPPMKSFLGVPIVAQGQALGNLYLAEKQGAEGFSEEEEALVAAFASQAALAIANARLHEEAEEQARQAQAAVAQLRQVSTAAAQIASDLDLERTLERIVQLMAETRGTTKNSILLVDEERQELVHGAAVGLPAEYVQAIARFPIGPSAAC